jgi:hypothetical protein
MKIKSMLKIHLVLFVEEVRGFVNGNLKVKKSRQ